MRERECAAKKTNSEKWAATVFCQTPEHTSKLYPQTVDRALC